MEGRRPPPKASHPYPNKVNLTKWWGTPMPWSFFKFATTFLGVFGSLFAISMHFKLKENARKQMTQQEFEQLWTAQGNSFDFSLKGIRASYGALDMLKSPEEKLQAEIIFDAPYDVDIVSHEKS